MIIGAGDIGSALIDREGAILFASGVSNSNCESDDEFLREFNELMQQPKDKCLFYFSSISIYLKTTPYFQHKRVMERSIKTYFPNYNIIRIGNIDWGKNPNTFLNNLRAKKAAGEKLEVRDEYKYMISKEQFNLIVSSLPLTGQNEINIFGDMKKVADLI